MTERVEAASAPAELAAWARALLARYGAIFYGVMPGGATGAEVLTQAMMAWLKGAELPQERLDRARAADLELQALRARAAQWSGDADGRWARLMGTLCSTDLERDAMALLLAFDSDPRVASTVRILSQWPEASGIERTFLQSVLDPFGSQPLAVATLLRDGSPLAQRHWIRGLGADPRRALFIDAAPALLTWLSQGPAAALASLPGARWVDASDNSPELLKESGAFDPETIASFLAKTEGDDALGVRVRGVRGMDAPLLAEVAGAQAGRSTARVDLSQASQRPQVVEDLDSGPNPMVLLAMAGMVASLEGAWLLLEGLDSETKAEGEPPLDAAVLCDIMRRLGGVTVLVDANPADAPGVATRLGNQLGLPLLEQGFPDRARRAPVWAGAIRAFGLGLDAAATEALVEFPLSIAQILDVTRQSAQTGEVDIAALSDACRERIAHRVGQLAQRVKTISRWEDIVLSEEIQGIADEIVNYANNRRRVFQDWGFGERHNYGLGLSALFSGPPGTGKTMLAGLIAARLRLDLFKIDLSRVVSKYIGETEERLARLFEEAERGGVALLFDEADSLFATRTEVKSSVDRYANLEVNFLLQKMEDFGGVVFLTSNMASSIDEAFRRRIRFHARFERPGADERERMWRAMLPAKAPLADDVDLGAMAEVYEFSGGEVKNASLRAAFYAVAEGGVITLEILDRAAQAESRERGRLTRRSVFDVL